MDHRDLARFPGLAPKRRTWKQKRTKAQLRHVAETTQGGTLAEVKRNIAHLRTTREDCLICARIANKLGI